MSTNHFIIITLLPSYYCAVISLFNPFEILCFSCSFWGNDTKRDIQCTRLKVRQRPKTIRDTVSYLGECPQTKSRSRKDTPWKQLVVSPQIFNWTRPTVHTQREQKERKLLRQGGGSSGAWKDLSTQTTNPSLGGEGDWQQRLQKIKRSAAIKNKPNNVELRNQRRGEEKGRKAKQVIKIHQRKEGHVTRTERQNLSCEGQI